MSNGFDGERQFPFPLTKKGKGYSKTLQSRATAILETLMGYLASNYRSTIPSTEYAFYLKAIATELARFTLAIEELSSDISFDLVRSEFLNQVVGYFVFLDEQPDIDLDDEEFREFLLTIIDIFFQGSTPSAIRQAVELFTDQEFEIKEIFKESQNPGSVYDISNQFAFTIEFELDNQFPTDPFVLQNNILLLINIVKPAHTLYEISHVFTDIVDPDNDKINDIIEDGAWSMHDRRYEDVRKNCGGMKGFSSETGYTELGALNVLEDDAFNKPLDSVALGANLIILEGPNYGHYRVVENLGSGIRVKPRFKEPQEDISYQVEVDRLGKKEEIFVTEDASYQFVSSEKLTVSIDGLISVGEGDQTHYEAVTNFSGSSTYEWDLTGDGNFGDATGKIVPFEAPLVPSPQFDDAGKFYWTIGVRATSGDGRIARNFVTITINKV